MMHFMMHFVFYDAYFCVFYRINCFVFKTQKRLILKEKIKENQYYGFP